MICLQELLLAEKWARIHHIPFPKIGEDIFEKEGLKELYVFKDEDDINAPIILHFCLCNVQFRKFSAPGKSVSHLRLHLLNLGC